VEFYYLILIFTINYSSFEVIFKIIKMEGKRKIDENTKNTLFSYFKKQNRDDVSTLINLYFVF